MRPQTFDILLLSFNRKDEFYEVKTISNTIVYKRETTIDHSFFANKAQVFYDTAIVPNSCDRGYGIFTMDDNSVFFLEKHLSTLFNLGKITNINLMVILQNFFKMMQDGLLPISRLQLILLHLLQIECQESIL